ncbi:MAG: hypothetical protein HFE73_01925 [Firmicutes bacterium]|nr:hypothetical protein [Bacillota bacterium]
MSFENESMNANEQIMVDGTKENQDVELQDTGLQDPEQLPKKKGGKWKAVRQKCKGKGSMVFNAVVLICLVVTMVQNNMVSEKLNKYLNNADGEIHEIYDDTKVLEAYRSGDDSKLDEKDKFVLDTAKSVIDEVIKDGMTPYEKEKAIYDWQVKWVNYAEDDLNPMTGGGAAYNHTPYGVLKFHQAICVGNSTTFKLFMDMLEIPCMIIHSTQSGEHAWNIVQIEDEWYHVDVTFDGSSNGIPSYSNFNVPDSVKDTGSWPYDHDEIPAANGTKYSYMLQNAQVIDDFYDIPKELKKAIDNNQGMLTFILKDKEGFNKQVAEYIGERFQSENGYIYFNGVYSLDGKAVYKYEINNYGNQTNNEELQKIFQKLDEIIMKLNDGQMGTGSTDGYDGDFQASATSGCVEVF